VDRKVRRWTGRCEDGQGGVQEGKRESMKMGS
jgi:hypothetical protein